MILLQWIYIYFYIHSHTYMRMSILTLQKGQKDSRYIFFLFFFMSSLTSCFILRISKEDFRITCYTLLYIIIFYLYYFIIPYHSFPEIFFLSFCLWSSSYGPYYFKYFILKLNEYEGRAEIITFLCIDRFYFFTQTHQWDKNMWLFKNNLSDRSIFFFFSFKCSFRTSVFKVLSLRQEFQIKTKVCPMDVISAG